MDLESSMLSSEKRSDEVDRLMEQEVGTGERVPAPAQVVAATQAPVAATAG